MLSILITLLCALVLQGSPGGHGHTTPEQNVSRKLKTSPFGLNRALFWSVILLIAIPVHSHNWLISNSRGKGFASTTKPCKPKARGDTTHYQLGPGQHFYVRYSTGHGSWAWFWIVHEDYMSKLADDRFKYQMAKDYIDNQPRDKDGKATNNTAHEREFKRWHMCHPRHNCYGKGDNKDWYPRIYEPEDKDYPITGGTGKEGRLYEWHDDKISTDERVHYKSDKYPGLEGVYRYKIVGHQPHDYDSIKVTIPAYNGPGHYIVHFVWRGYMDCIDVDVFDHQVEHVYGKPLPHPYWVKYDHCQFLNFKRVLGSIIDATFSPEALQERFEREGAPEYVGINVVPMALTGQNTFPVDPASLPYRGAGRNWDSPLLQLETKTPKRTDAWSTIANSINFVEVENKTCTFDSGHAYQYNCRNTPCNSEDYRNYVQLSVTESGGVFMAQGHHAPHDIPWPENNYFTMKCVNKNIVTVDPINNMIICCSQDDAIDKADWKRITWNFPAKASRASEYVQAPNMFMGGSWVNFSFQHETYRAPPGWWVDSGKPFGPQRTLMTKTYGEENGFAITGYGVFLTGNCGPNIITSMAECEAARKALSHTNWRYKFRNPDDIDSSRLPYSYSSLQTPAGCVWVTDKFYVGYYLVPENTTNKGFNCSRVNWCICKTPEDAFSNQQLKFGWRTLEKTSSVFILEPLNKGKHIYPIEYDLPPWVIEKTGDSNVLS